MSDVLIRIWTNASIALFCWHIKVVSSTQTLNSQLNIQLKFNCLLNYDNGSTQPRKGNINIATIVILFCGAEPHKHVLFTFNCKEFSWESGLRRESHSFRQEGRPIMQKIVSRLRWIEKSKHTLYRNKKMEAIFHSFVYIKANGNYGNDFEWKEHSTKIFTGKGHSAGGFSLFSSVSPDKCQGIYSRRTRPLYSEYFSIWTFFDFSTIWLSLL